MSIEIIEKIKSIPEAYVDVGVLQGQNALLSRMLTEEVCDANFPIQEFIEDANQAIDDLIHRASPHIIPDIYLHFLGFYGGFIIESENYYLSTFGLGAMVEELYAGIDSDDSFPGLLEKTGMLPIAHLSFRRGGNEGLAVNFFMDLANKIKKNSIIGIGPWGKGTPIPETILGNLTLYKDYWKDISDSFEEWSEMSFITKGKFKYM